MKAELERLAAQLCAVGAMPGSVATLDGAIRDLRAIAARCDNNPTEEKEVMQFDSAEREAVVHQPVAKPPVSETGGDQPAGEPVPLPEPAGAIEGWEYSGSIGKHRVRIPAYTAHQLREYAETVAAPLRHERDVWRRSAEGWQARAELADKFNTAMANEHRAAGCELVGDKIINRRAETAERERDEARRDEARYRFVRDPDNYPDHDWWADILGACDDGQSFDAAIDSAMGDDNGK